MAAVTVESVPGRLGARRLSVTTSARMSGVTKTMMGGRSTAGVVVMAVSAGMALTVQTPRPRLLRPHRHLMAVAAIVPVVTIAAAATTVLAIAVGTAATEMSCASGMTGAAVTTGSLATRAARPLPGRHRRKGLRVRCLPPAPPEQALWTGAKTAERRPARSWEPQIS